MTDTAQKICGIIADILELPPDNISLDKKISELLQVDSVIILEILVAIERQFNIKVNESEYKTIETVQNIVDLVDKKTHLL